MRRPVQVPAITVSLSFALALVVPISAAVAQGKPPKDTTQMGDVVLIEYRGVPLAGGQGAEAGGSHPPSVSIESPGTSTATRTPLILIRYSDADGNLDSAIIVKWGGAHVAGLGRSNSGLWEWEVDGASYELSPGGTKQVYVKVCDFTELCTTVTRNVTLGASPRPILSLKTMPLESHGRQFAAPFGGFGVTGADIGTGFSTPAYFSLNSARTAGLTYSSRQSYPRALVNVNLEFPTTLPTSLTMRLKDGAATLHQFTLGSLNCPISGSTYQCRVALEASFLSGSYTPAVRKWLRVEAQASFPATYTVAESVEVVLVDRRTTPYGSGWWPTGIMRLVTAGADAVIVASDGSATVYRGNTNTYPAVYLSPPGSRLVLVKLTNNTWELRFRGGGKVTFDYLGRQTGIVDANGNTMGITYDGTTEKVVQIKDPLNKAYTFSYGGANGTVSAITDPGSRSTSVTIDASRMLVRVGFPSPPGRTYRDSLTWAGYTGSAVLPLSRVDGLGAVTRVAYTAGLRPWRDTLPTVQDEYGNNVKPVVEYNAQELMALGTTVPLTSLYTEVKDPRGNWTRSELNRWGSAVRTWDALGTLGVNTDDAAGRVLTAEGKAGDSTRVYQTYDGAGRLVRLHRLRPGGSMHRLDSLVYDDATDRVLRRVDPQGNVTYLTYDGYGNLIQSIAPRPDTTRTWYGAGIGRPRASWEEPSAPSPTATWDPTTNSPRSPPARTRIRWAGRA